MNRRRAGVAGTRSDRGCPTLSATDGPTRDWESPTRSCPHRSPPFAARPPSFLTTPLPRLHLWGSIVTRVVSFRRPAPIASDAGLGTFERQGFLLRGAPNRGAESQSCGFRVSAWFEGCVAFGS